MFFIILLLLFWVIFPFLTQIKPYYIYESNQYFQIDNLTEFFSDFFYSANKWNVGFQFIKTSIIILGLLGIFKYFKKPKIFYFFIFQFIFLFLITYLHNIIPWFNLLSNIQPYKYAFPLILVLIIPCSIFINKSIKKFKYNKFNLKHIYISIFILLILVQVFDNHLIHPIKQKPFTEPPDDYVELVEWVKENTNNEGRILFEMGLPSSNMFDKPSFLYGLFSLDTNRQILGGLHGYSPFAHNFPSLTQDRIFQKNWNINDKELMNYFELYNVGWVIVRSKDSRIRMYEKYINNSNLFKNRTKLALRYYEEKPYSKFNIYEINRNLTFIFGGTANVSADFNLIKINNLKSNRKDIILKYHWHPTLKATKGLKIKPVYILDAPVPFIKVTGINTPEFEIYNSYNK